MGVAIELRICIQKVTKDIRLNSRAKKTKTNWCFCILKFILFILKIKSNKIVIIILNRKILEIFPTGNPDLRSCIQISIAWHANLVYIKLTFKIVKSVEYSLKTAGSLIRLRWFRCAVPPFVLKVGPCAALASQIPQSI